MTASNANKKVKDIFVSLNKNENTNYFYRRLSKTGYEYVLIVMYSFTNVMFTLSLIVGLLISRWSSNWCNQRR